MTQNEMKRFADELTRRGRMRFIEGATAEQIEAFERANAFPLPLGFKKWLAFSDGGDLFLPAGIQLHGVAHKPLLDVSDDDRPDDRYLVIGVLSMGDPIVCEKSSERISIYNHEAGRIEDDETYSDFDSFLADLNGILGAG